MGDRSRGRYATPAEFPRHDGSPYRELHVRCECLGCVHRSRVIFCRAVSNLNVTIRNFCIAIAVWGFDGAYRARGQHFGVVRGVGAAHQPAAPRVHLPVDGALPRREADELVLPVDADERHVLRRVGQDGQLAAPASDRDGQLLLLRERVALRSRALSAQSTRSNCRAYEGVAG